MSSILQAGKKIVIFLSQITLVMFIQKSEITAKSVLDISL